MTRQQHEAWKIKRSLDGANVSANQIWENQFYNDKVKMQLVQIVMLLIDTYLALNCTNSLSHDMRTSSKW